MESAKGERALSVRTVVVAAKDQLGCDLADEAVILNLKSGVYYGLDSVGAQVWKLIQKPRTIPEIRDAILEEYDVEVDRCERDLRELVQELAGMGLIEVKDEPTAEIPAPPLA
jgi:hypothetical protein